MSFSDPESSITRSRKFNPLPPDRGNGKPLAREVRPAHLLPFSDLVEPVRRYVRHARSVRVLLVEDNPADARLVREMLRDANAVRFEITYVDRLAEALCALKEEPFDAVLLDLGLPDVEGLEALTPISNTAPDLPVVVLSGQTDEGIGLQAVQLGAQDYIVKGSGDGNVLARTLRYAIERKRSEEHITHVANHDSLTNLPNRRLLFDCLAQALTRARRSEETLAFLFLDLDHFKTINEAVGHMTGDLLLQAVARRLADCVHEGDTLARLAGDDFVLVVPGIARAEDAIGHAEKLHAALKPGFSVGRYELDVSASIGISIFPGDAQDAETLLRHAETAMYRAKKAGRNTHHLYSEREITRTSGQMEMGNALRHALDRNEFSLQFQPQVDISSSKIVGMEALLRWRHSELGLVAPAQFISLAEESGLILPIGEWVLRNVCKQIQKWSEVSSPAFRVAVNLSTRELSQSHLLGIIARALKESGLSAKHLDLEITEIGMMHNETAAASTLQKLKSIGVRLTLDDFGTGYSSLIHLKHSPIDAVKIDRSFVRDMAEDPHDAAIVKAIISMAHGLHMQVIAVGVETQQQLALLRSYGCDQAQGHYFSPPLFDEDLTHLVHKGASCDNIVPSPRTLALINEVKP